MGMVVGIFGIVWVVGEGIVLVVVIVLFVLLIGY